MEKGRNIEGAKGQFMTTFYQLECGEREWWERAKRGIEGENGERDRVERRREWREGDNEERERVNFLTRIVQVPFFASASEF